MKQATQIIHTVDFGKYRQDWELSFKYDKECTDDVKVTAHNYRNSKFIYSNDITKSTEHLHDAMIESLDLDDMRTNGYTAAFDRRFDDMFEKLSDINIRPQQQG